LTEWTEIKRVNLVIVDYKSGKAPMAKYKEPRFFALEIVRILIKKNW
jgi:RecB family exonuclease